MIKKNNLFIPMNTVACKYHTEIGNWIELRRTRLKFTYTKSQMEEMIELLRMEDHNQDLIKLNDRNRKAQTGLNILEFEQLYQSVPSLLISCKNSEPVAKEALYTYLIKLRTGLSDEEVASIRHVSRSTVTRRCTIARTALMTDFVPRYVNCEYQRQELQSHTTTLVRDLFCDGNADKVAIIFDGTYIYINKSGNFAFQKFTYNDQKKRNFVKPMMAVAPDGTILFVYGLYPAVQNDASIINEMMNKHETVFNQLAENDVIILDRGFRDCQDVLKQKGFIIKMPEFVKAGSSQLTTKEANYSRLVTKCRFIVETRNGHLKQIWN